MEYGELEDYIRKGMKGEWIGKVKEVKRGVEGGKEIGEEMKIVGDEGVAVEYEVRLWKWEVIELVMVEEDGLEEIEGVSGMEGEEEMVKMVMEMWDREFELEKLKEVMD